MWVQLKVSKTIEIHGRAKRFHPGDWVDIGKQSALMMVSLDEATIPDTKKLAQLLPQNSSIYFTGNTNSRSRVAAGVRAMGLQPQRVDAVAKYELLTHQNVLIAEPGAMTRAELIPVGFMLLEKWQIAMPLGSYEQMACHIGEADDRAITQAIIRDLRAPWYDTRLIFARRCPDTRALFDAWKDESQALKGKTDERLAFLRALYRVKPIVCALPTTWLKS